MQASLAILALLALLTGVAAAAEADPVGVFVGRCGAVVDPDPNDPAAAAGCGTFACYVDTDQVVRCFG
jgi:hypothetical protein